MISQAIILVGGKGERLSDGGRFTPVEETPKPLIEVGGKPFVTYLIRMLHGVGIQDVVLLVGYKKEDYAFLREQFGVRLCETRSDVNEAVLAIPNLEEMFLLMNGDCLPIMDYEKLRMADHAFTTIKICGRDAGCAVVRKCDIGAGIVSVQDIGAMGTVYSRLTILGGLHIGTYQGLERARQFIDLVVYGQ